MADPDFQPYRRSIEELLTGSDYYVIPRFQRPYSWDSGNLDEFWRDVIEDNDAGYFIGPMVAWRRGAPPVLAVVDGQQRLTTVILLLVVIRDARLEQGRVRLAKGVHRYIERPDRDNELRFVLQPEITSAFLNNAILREEPARGIGTGSEEEHALKQAHLDLRDRRQKAVRERPQPETELRRIRDKVLGLRVIWIEHGNEDDAYVVFETLNSRGKDLEVVDLLKNHLLNKLRHGKNRTARPVPRALQQHARTPRGAGCGRRRQQVHPTLVAIPGALRCAAEAVQRDQEAGQDQRGRRASTGRPRA